MQGFGLVPEGWKSESSLADFDTSIVASSHADVETIRESTLFCSDEEAISAMVECGGSIEEAIQLVESGNPPLSFVSPDSDVEKMMKAFASDPDLPLVFSTRYRGGLFSFCCRPDTGEELFQMPLRTDDEGIRRVSVDASLILPDYDPLGEPVLLVTRRIGSPTVDELSLFSLQGRTLLSSLGQKYRSSLYRRNQSCLEPIDGISTVACSWGRVTESDSKSGIELWDVGRPSEPLLGLLQKTDRSRASQTVCDLCSVSRRQWIGAICPVTYRFDPTLLHFWSVETCQWVADFSLPLSSVSRARVWDASICELKSFPAILASQIALNAVPACFISINTFESQRSFGSRSRCVSSILQHPEQHHKVFLGEKSVDTPDENPRISLWDLRMEKAPISHVTFPEETNRLTLEAPQIDRIVSLGFGKFACCFNQFIEIWKLGKSDSMEHLVPTKRSLRGDNLNALTCDDFAHSSRNDRTERAERLSFLVDSELFLFVFVRVVVGDNGVLVGFGTDLRC